VTVAKKKTKAKAKGATLRVRQVRSGIGFNKDQKATLRALGLGKIGRVRQFPDNPHVRAMVGTIPHLVVIEGNEG
jgi:large subunit ribosomal protein L30